jgi:glucose-1-phosphate thymidylyltransferase
MAKQIKHGVILLGGNGTRLQPFTKAINKSLLNINGKAVVEYPINTLKQMGVENVSIILGGDHFSQPISFLQDGSQYGMNFNFLYQGQPKGISQAINLAKNFVGTDQFAVILGDNLYEDPVSFDVEAGAQIALYNHRELKRFGVASLKDDKIVKIEEKPKVLSEDTKNYAITGCYLFDNLFFDFFKESKPSLRQEYEITEIIEKYHSQNLLKYSMVSGLWADAGTHESIAELNNYFYNKRSTI